LDYGRRELAIQRKNLALLCFRFDVFLSRINESESDWRMVSEGRVVYELRRSAMSYKSIVVHVDNTVRAKVRIEFARVLAERFDAHLTGIYTAGRLEIPGYLRAEMGEVFLRHREESVAQQKQAAQTQFFDSASGLRPSRMEFQAIEGEPMQAMLAPSQYADLQILGQSESPPPSGMTVSQSFPEDLVLASKRPTLVIPYAGEFTPAFEYPIIAWKPTGEAMRAVRDALPILTQAKRVTVVCVEAPNDSRAEQGSEIALYLARHNVPVEVLHDHSGQPDAGIALLNQACDLQCDLMVMGCYGHSRLREMALGGVSRTILKSMTIPVFFAH
jgi:nucleotide-binding universal stress UspA family protein